MNPRSRLTAALLTLGLLPCTGARTDAGDWPRFRGPNGSGIATDTAVPVEWTKANVSWKTAVPGEGNSSPIVSGDRVFLQSASADGRQRWLVCLSAVTGDILWKVEAPGNTAKTHRKNTLASGTPATDGERVYALFWNGEGLILAAFDVKGGQLWRRDLGPFRSQHGAGHSPVVYDGRVFVADDQDGSAVLLAFDARTGEPAWHAERKAFRACYSTPFVLLEGSGPPQLIVASTAGITSYDPRTGDQYWHYTWGFARSPLRTVASPVAAAGVIFAASGDGSGERNAIAVRTGGKGDLPATSLAWENRKAFPYVPTVLARGEHLFSVSDQGIAACHEARTGKEVWTARLGSPVSASPILVNDKIYAAAEDGTVFVYPAATKFKLLARNTLGEGVVATPAVADNRLFIRGKEHLYCITAKPVK